jgi:hypothetical protein
MNMIDFLSKYGSNVQSNESWIFPDSNESFFLNQYVLIGFDEKQSATGTIIPVLILQDTQSKTNMLLSLWSTDKQSLNNIELSDIVKLRKPQANERKISLIKVPDIPA